MESRFRPFPTALARLLGQLSFGSDHFLVVDLEIDFR
jgi:hypothetical protein